MFTNPTPGKPKITVFQTLIVQQPHKLICIKSNDYRMVKAIT